MLDHVATGVPAPPALSYDPLDRTHRLTPPTGLFARFSRASLDWLERLVAKHSVHPDRPVYDNALFPWADDLAAAWPDVRAELDRVMVRQHQIPSFQDILDVHLGLQVPAPAVRCRVRIGDRIRRWNEGELLILDDTFDHEVWNDTDGWRVVLFVDFVRPMHAPWKWMNEGFIGLGALLPFLRAAGAKQKRWAKLFYGDERNSAAK